MQKLGGLSDAATDVLSEDKCVDGLQYRLAVAK